MSEKQVGQEARRVVEGGDEDQRIQQAQLTHGNNRTPDKPIGEIKYADNDRGGEQKSQAGCTRTDAKRREAAAGALMDEHEQLHARKGGEGLRGQDKQQADLRPHEPTFKSPMHERPEQQRSPHQDAQHGADVRGNPPMQQSADSLPEGLTRERKVPYDKNVGRNEEAPHVPKWSP